MNITPIIWDPSLLFNAPTSYLYDPSPTGNNDPVTGKPVPSSNAYNQSYVLRSGELPSTMIQTNTPGNPFSAQILKTSTGQAVNVSALSPSDISDIYSGSFKQAFNACTADPTCYAIAVQNNQPVGSIGATYGNTLKYSLTLYQKPDLVNTPANTPANTPVTYDPIERLSCDPDKVWYTFLKNTPGAINPNGALTCPVVVPPPTTSTAPPAITFAPSTACKCPDDPTMMDQKNSCYYYCNPIKPPVPSIWTSPTTWIIIFISIAVIGGVGYYFYKKRQNESANTDYSKYFKKKGGYFFFH
jgi:hypothetical protein